MAEVTVIGEDLSGLGWTLKSLIDANLSNPDLRERLRKLQGTLVVKETRADVSVTLFFDKGDLRIKEGDGSRPSAHLEAGFEELAEVASGQVGPIRALLTRRIKAGGNLLKLLRMAEVIISKKAD
jgi:putative sterol carrier protein